MITSLAHALEGDEHRLLRETVRRFVEEHVRPVAAKIDKEDRFPSDLFQKMADLGLTGLMIPETFGGFGEDLLATVITFEELGRVSPAMALSLLAHTILGALPIVRYGTPDQKARYLPLLAQGKWIGGTAYTEPNAGSDAASIQTRAQRVEGGWKLYGSKMFITNGSIARLLVVYAKTDPEAGHRGISSFLVEVPTEGFSVSQDFEKMGMRGSPTSVLYFDGVFVPDDRLLGTLNRGFYQIMHGFNTERIAIVAISVGILREVLDWMLEHATVRKQFGKPLGSFQLIQDKIAQTFVDLELARTYLYLTARSYNAQEDWRLPAATIKIFAAEAATQRALDGIQVLGGYGYTQEYPLERLMRDAKLMEIGAGTTEMMKRVIARSLLKQWGFDEVE